MNMTFLFFGLYSEIDGFVTENLCTDRSWLETKRWSRCLLSFKIKNTLLTSCLKSQPNVERNKKPKADKLYEKNLEGWVSKEMQRQIAERIAVLTQEQRFKDQAFGRVVPVLRGFLPPSSCGPIVEDAIGDVRMKLLERLPELSAAQLADFAAEEEEKDSYLRLYLLRGVRNYALDRYRRWRSGSAPSQHGDIGSEPSDVQRGARTRIETEDLVATLDSHGESEDCHATALDLDRVDQLLEAKGLSEEEIDLLKARLSGLTYKELAELYGGTPDKYRKIVARALERSGLDLKL
jgi:DNA-directed RNA polymerase specialized sigma24 family protein